MNDFILWELLDFLCIFFYLNNFFLDFIRQFFRKNQKILILTLIMYNIKNYIF